MTVVEKVQNKVPQLRFPEFSGEWEKSRLGNVATFLKGKSISKADTDPEGKLECIRYGELYTHYDELIERIRSKTNLDKKALVLSKEGDVIIPASGESALDIATASCVKKEGVAYSGDLNILRSSVNGLFLAYYLNNKRKHDIARFAQGASVIHLYATQMKSLLLWNPKDSKENDKIASFVATVDKKISLLKQKHEQLVQYKKGIMQQLFSQQLRFKDDNGQDFPDWEVTRFKQHFERVTQKNKINNLNVLTISGQRGLINQQKYFNKSVSAQDVTGYYLMNKGEFAYNKSYSKGYPMGAIKRLNNYDQGVVSTLYICFKSKNGDDRFWEQYFEAGLLNREIQKIAQEGARNHGLLNVSVKEFFDDMKMHSPSETEQEKIADFLGAIDQKINLAQQQIEQTQAYKQGLLQQMFV